MTTIKGNLTKSAGVFLLFLALPVTPAATVAAIGAIFATVATLIPIALDTIAALAVALAFATLNDRIHGYNTEKIAGILCGIVIGLLLPAVFITTTTTTLPQPSTYEGIVQAIYTNSPSYILFQSGEKWYGNVSSVANLRIGADCTLIQNATYPVRFISGSCKAST